MSKNTPGGILPPVAPPPIRALDDRGKAGESNPDIPRPQDWPVWVRVLLGEDEAGKPRVESLQLEEYLECIVPAEMPAQWPIEALKAQAVAARTFALRASRHPRHRAENADLCATQHCQVYDPRKRHARSTLAAHLTAGQVMSHVGELIEAVYSASCGGKTKSAEEVGWNAKAYLVGVDCINEDQPAGHGVGLCQRGARDMAEAGASYLEILHHYYTNVTVRYLGSGTVIAFQGLELLEEAIALLRQQVSGLDIKVEALTSLGRYDLDGLVARVNSLGLWQEEMKAWQADTEARLKKLEHQRWPFWR